MNTNQPPQPTPDQWKDTIEMLLEVERVLADSVVSARVEEHDHHIIGLPSGVQGAMPGGARIEAALHAVMAARNLVRQAVSGSELPGVPVLQRAQNNLAVAGGYVAAVWNTELFENIDNRSK